MPSARRRAPLGPVLSCADATKPWKALPVELPAGLSATPGKPRKPAVAAGPVLTDAEVRQLEAENICAALRQARGKVSGTGGAAELLGLKRTTLASRIKSLGILLPGRSAGG